MAKSKKVLVTGGTGFIGTYLVERLVKDGYKVRCLVRKSSDLEILKKLGVEFSYGDLIDKESLVEAVKGVSVVYHLGAVLGSFGAPQEVIYNVNVNGTRNLLEECFKQKVKRFIHFSTFSVYGYTKTPANEETPQVALASYYAKTKRIGEKIAKEYMDKGMDIAIIQPCVIHGPRLNFGFGGTFTAVKNKKFMLIGDGGNLLHLGYIDNFIEGTMLVGERKESKGQTYIIGDEVPLPFEVVIKNIAEILGVKLPRVRMPEMVARMSVPYLKVLSKFTGGGQPLLTHHRINFMTQNQAGDISKIKKELGYEPKISSREGLERTVKYYRENGFFGE